MNVHFTNKFKKQYQKLPNDIRCRTKNIIEDLKIEPFPVKLSVHKLHGKLSGYYACSIDYSYRIIFQIENGAVVLLLIGDHDIYDA